MSGRGGRKVRLVAATLGAVLVGGVTSACSSPPPTPDEAVQALAAALEQGDLDGVPLAGTTTGAATAQLRTATQALDPRRPAVEVGRITVDDEGSTATAVLTQTWDIDDGPQDWSYETQVPLELVETEDAEQWQVSWSTALIAPDLSPTQVLATERSRAERAPVLGADGVVLVEPRPVLRLGVDKTWVEPDGHERAAREVAELLDLDPAAFAERVSAAGEQAFVEAIVVRVGDPDHDIDAFREIIGSRAVEDTLPLAPSRRFARPVLGTSGPATAEIVESSDGAVAAGDLVGLSGLQRQYDAQLRGRAGIRILAVETNEAAAADDESDVATPEPRELFALDPVAGEPLRTTLDPEAQDAAETILEDVEPAAAIVAIRPSTGAVLAAASGPGGEGHSTATLGTFAPGSVFKVVSSLAALRAGLTPDSEVACPASITVDGREFRNFPGYPAEATGTIDLRTAVAHSCNTAFIGLREEAPAAALVEAAASLGLGGDADLGYPLFLGSVPSDATGTDLAATMIGQGRVQASPLAMGAVAASVAAGRTVSPWLVGAEAPEAAAPSTPLSETETEQLRVLMRAVVTDGGATFLEGDGPDVLAKTGTAQTGAGDEMHNHAWMIAVRDDLAVAVFVEEGDYGSTTAGPLLEKFLGAVVS